MASLLSLSLLGTSSLNRVQHIETQATVASALCMQSLMSLIRLVVSEMPYVIGSRQYQMAFDRARMTHLVCCDAHFDEPGEPNRVAKIVIIFVHAVVEVEQQAVDYLSLLLELDLASFCLLHLGQ